MSSFSRKTYHPDTGIAQRARWADDYFGDHLYGVMFTDNKVFRADAVTQCHRSITIGAAHNPYLNLAKMEPETK